MDNSYNTGNCDIMALALHRLTGYQLGIFSGKVPSEDEHDGYYYEDAHAVVIIDLEDLEWIDANGVSSGMPENLYFNGAISEIVLRPVSEGDIRSAFTTEEISDDSIYAAMQFAIKNIFHDTSPATSKTLMLKP